jgi:DNA-binding NarL/FixJ family response regulator
MIRVLVADDHAPTREEVCEALSIDPRFDVCAQAADAARAIDQALAMRPDVCLLDINMPGNGLAAVWELTARLPQVKVVMLTVSEDADHLFAALRAGASGYLLKDMDFSRLPHALVDVLEGRAAIPHSLMARILEEFRDRGPRRRVVDFDEHSGRLTSREWQVIELLRQGRSTRQIARELVLSPATIRSHIHAIVRKLRAEDRESALRAYEARSGT